MMRWRRHAKSGEEDEGPALQWLGGVGEMRPESGQASEARLRMRDTRAPAMPSCEEYVDRYLAEYARQNRPSSLHTQTSRLRRFRADFKGRSLDMSRAELKDWINGEGPWSERGPIPPCELPAIISLYNHAIDESDLPIMRSPARKLTPRSRGRADQAPPSREEFETILDACSVLGSYGERMRALVLFAAHTLMRPSELYALEWTDIDFDGMRIRKLRRAYRGTLDEPKSGKRLIALTPPARDAIHELPREGELVFTSMSGRRLSGPIMSEYWNKVLDAAGVRYHFYHATKHYGVHYMWTKLGLSPRAIAAQAGWKLHMANRMLAIYGHGEIGALEEVDGAFGYAVEAREREAGARPYYWHVEPPRRSVAGAKGQPGAEHRVSTAQKLRAETAEGQDEGHQVERSQNVLARQRQRTLLRPADPADDFPGRDVAERLDSWVTAAERKQELI